MYTSVSLHTPAIHTTTKHSRATSLDTAGDGPSRSLPRDALEPLPNEPLAPAHDRLVQPREHLDRRRPVDTRIRDGHAVLERGGPLGRDVLAPRVDVRLDHHARDVPLAGEELLADRRDDLRLVVVVLLRVAVCARAKTERGRKLVGELVEVGERVRWTYESSRP